MSQETQELFNKFLMLEESERIEFMNLVNDHIEPQFEDDEFNDDEEDEESDENDDDD